jgi:hypothetical protein
MGANFSKTELDVATTIVTKSLTTSCTEVQSTMKSDIVVDQKINFKVTGGAKVVCAKGANFSNVSVTNASVLHKAFSENNTDIQNKIVNDVTTAIKNMLTQENSQLNLGQVNANYVKQYARNDITNDVKNAFKNTVKQTMNINSTNQQSIDITFDGRRVEVSGVCEITNDSLVKLVVEDALKSLCDVAHATYESNDVSTSLDNSVSQTSAGVDPTLLLFGGIFGGIVLVIIVIIIIVVVISKSGSSGGKK